MTWQRFIFCSDLHGDRQDPDTVEALFRFLVEWKPEIVIFGGDLVDLRPLRKGAGADEKRESMRADIDAGREFIDRLFSFGKPGQRYFHDGNHDHRLTEAAESSDGPLADLAGLGLRERNSQLKRLRAHVLPYHKRNGVLRIGHLKTLHGFFCGVFATRQHAQVYGGCLVGHTHVVDEHAVPGLERRVARSVGALCLLDMDYNSRQPNTLRQAHGWAWGVVNSKTGNYFTYQAEKIDGVWNWEIAQ